MTQATQTIPAGYKQTEIGVIPEDWDVKKFGKIVNRIVDNRGKTPPYSARDNVELIETASISFVNSYPDYSKIVKFVSEYTYKNWFRDHPKKDYILISTVGEYSGSSAILEANRGTVAQNLIGLKVLDEMNPKFVFYWTRSSCYRKQLDQVMMSQAQPSLRVPWLLNFQIPFPTDPTEQTAIAAALSDTDALIEKLEKLIAKKKAIKQGAMQQLLTGKKRLPGFNGEWDVKKLKDVSWFQEGPGVRTSQFTQSGVKLLNGTNIYKGIIDLTTTDRYISEKEAYGSYAHFMANEEDIVIASSGITIDKFEEKIAFVKKRNLPFCMNTSTIRFKVDKNLLIDRFLYYFFMTTNFKKQIGAQATGSAQLNFGPSHLEKVIIDIPIDKKEQTAIATVLSDMDAEIEKLENKLNKYRQIKTGMMQQLLTGKIRLLKN